MSKMGNVAHNFLNIMDFQSEKQLSKNLNQKVYQSMSKMAMMIEMGKEHTHTFWLITSLILNGFSI